MATVDFPGEDTCRILREGYTETMDPNVRRTEFQDGSIAQKISRSRNVMVRRFTIIVRDEDMTTMREWLVDHGHDYFDFTDIDQTTRECRIRGGVGAVQFEAVAGERLLTTEESESNKNDAYKGDMYHRATLELEGYI